MSWVGPSQIFRDCAQAAKQNGNRMFAKLHVGCSHEVATARAAGDLAFTPLDAGEAAFRRRRLAQRDWATMPIPSYGRGRGFGAVTS